jgi:hypothetical protein
MSPARQRGKSSHVTDECGGKIGGDLAPGSRLLASMPFVGQSDSMFVSQRLQLLPG